MNREEFGLPFKERFWAKVDKKGPDECWPWLACKSASGYGQFKFEGRMWAASRIALILKIGHFLAESEYACHTCDNKACCNPKHIYLGSASSNVQDAYDRGLRRVLRYEEHGRAILNWEQVRYARSQYPTKGYSCIGRELGISPQLVYHIIKGNIWNESTAL